jgi:acyl dehydratase
MKRSISSHTAKAGYFEDFKVGARMRHARRTTISEGESHLLTKLVMNTRAARSRTSSSSASSPARW